MEDLSLNSLLIELWKRKVIIITVTLGIALIGYVVSQMYLKTIYTINYEVNVQFMQTNTNNNYLNTYYDLLNEELDQYNLKELLQKFLAAYKESNIPVDSIEAQGKLITLEIKAKEESEVNDDITKINSLTVDIINNDILEKETAIRNIIVESIEYEVERINYTISTLEDTLSEIENNNKIVLASHEEDPLYNPVYLELSKMYAVTLEEKIKYVSDLATFDKVYPLNIDVRSSGLNEINFHKTEFWVTSLLAGFILSLLITYYLVYRDIEKSN